MRWGEGAFQGAFHACLLCEAAEFSRHVNICFVRPPEFHIKEQIMFFSKEVAVNALVNQTVG